MPYVTDGPRGKQWVTKSGSSFGLMNGMGSGGRQYIPGQIHRSDRMASTGLYEDGKKGIRRTTDPELRLKDQAFLSRFPVTTQSKVSWCHSVTTARDASTAIKRSWMKPARLVRRYVEKISVRRLARFADYYTSDAAANAVSEGAALWQGATQGQTR